MCVCGVRIMKHRICQERFLIKGPVIRVPSGKLETCLKLDLFQLLFPGRKLFSRYGGPGIDLSDITNFELIVLYFQTLISRVSIL